MQRSAARARTSGTPEPCCVVCSTTSPRSSTSSSSAPGSTRPAYSPPTDATRARRGDLNLPRGSVPLDGGDQGPEDDGKVEVPGVGLEVVTDLVLRRVPAPVVADSGVGVEDDEGTAPTLEVVTGRQAPPGRRR